MKSLLIFLVLISLGCKKSEDRACWKFNGASIEKRVDLESFDRLDLGPFMDFHLIQDTLSFVVIKGGENVVNLVTSSVNNGELKIANENKCRFLRNSKKIITVEIHYVQLTDIAYKGSGKMTNEGILNSPNFTVVLSEGSGSIDLNVNCGFLEISAEPSWSDYKVKGVCNQARFTVKGNSFGDTRDLTVNNLITVLSISSGDLKINADNTGVLKCETRNNGNVYYYGTPSWIDWNDYGDGKLLQGE